MPTDWLLDIVVQIANALDTNVFVVKGVIAVLELQQALDGAARVDGRR